MKIVHLCFVEPYLDNWSYQANLLPEYHAKLGHDVVVIAGMNHCPKEYQKFHETEEHKTTYQISRVRIIRLPLSINILNRLILPKGLYPVLVDEKPDLIYMHSLNNLSVFAVTRYKRKHRCLLYADIHSDMHNSGRNFLSRNLLHGLFWRTIYLFQQNNLDRIFAITADCADFAARYNGIDRKRIELLYLGADTDAIQYHNRRKIRGEIRSAYGIGEDDFMLVTAGKIEPGKKTDLLIKAVQRIESDRIRVIVIGSCEKSYLKQLQSLAGEDNRILFTGWQESARLNDFFLASDAAVFPGTQSVIWQTAICCGLPVILRWWGDTVGYLNIGNAAFINTDDPLELADHIKNLLVNQGLLRKMGEKAMELCATRLSYNVIARCSLPDGQPGRKQEG